MRERQHLDIKQLAEKTGYKEEYLNKIEEGKISPPVGALISISRALAVDSKTLLSEDKRETQTKLSQTHQSLRIQIVDAGRGRQTPVGLFGRSRTQEATRNGCLQARG